jgi:hypothetical protein
MEPLRGSLKPTLMRTEPSKSSVRGKIKQAAWSEEFTLDMIRAAVKD